MMLGFLIQLSAKSWTAWDDVNRVAQQHLRNGEPLPGMLASWVADVLAKNKKRKRPTQRGRPPKKGRNGTIVDIIEKLQGVDFSPYRNEATEHRRSGCEVVADAFGMKLKTVESIWQDHTNWLKITDAEREWVGLDLPLS